AMGASALLRHRTAVGGPTGQRSTARRDRVPCRTPMVPSRHGRACELWLFHHPALVLPGLEGANRPGRQAAPQAACRCRAATRNDRRGAPGGAGAIRVAQGLECQASPRQSNRARREQTRPAAGAVLFHAAALSQGRWPPQAPPPTSRRTAGAARAEARLFDREVRSYEAEYVGGIWHWDCHVGSKKVLTPRGEWQPPVLFGVLDDRSRLACHLQWYLTENAE